MRRRFWRVRERSYFSSTCARTYIYNSERVSVTCHLHAVGNMLRNWYYAMWISNFLLHTKFQCNRYCRADACKLAAQTRRRSGTHRSTWGKAYFLKSVEEQQVRRQSDKLFEKKTLKLRRETFLTSSDLRPRHWAVHVIYYLEICEPDSNTIAFGEARKPSSSI